MLPSSSLPGFSGQQERLEPQRLQLLQRAPGALGIPPVDQPDAVEVTVAALLQFGDVLVVDPEHPLAQRLVRVVEQGQDRVREREFLVDAVFGELADPGLDVVRRGPGQIVVLHQHAAEVAAGPGLALHADHVRAVLVPDARRGALELLGEAFEEDVLGHRDVVVGGEDLGARGQADESVPRRGPCGILGAPQPSARYSVGDERADSLLGWTSVALQSGCAEGSEGGDYQVTGSS